METNIGWVETYIDPENARAYYSGWVALVDKEKSRKFNQLVVNSEQIVPQLPWPREMEKDKFLAPDFTTLDLVGYASSNCFLGLNIPNYDDIRESEGFKNMFFNNNQAGRAVGGSMQFASPEQSNLLLEYTKRAYEVHVACHELLGHGVGKLTYRSEDGKSASFVDPLTGEAYESCYEPGETYTIKFGQIASSYEECRADTCGFFLGVLPDVYSLFGW